jgi:hypothetical protein
LLTTISVMSTQTHWLSSERYTLIPLLLPAEFLCSQWLQFICCV